jgi:hypothetical protein
MSNNKLAALKAAFGKPDSEGGQREQFVSNYYPFWNMKTGQKAVIRFLPDADSSNARGFLVEKTSHNLVINGQKKTVPCLSMYGEDCPVCKISQAYYKEKDEVNGKKYWKKKQYIAQAIIVDDPLPADETTGETHQGKVRYIALGYQIYNIIKEAFASEDDPLEAIPYEFEGGYDFVIKKTEQGEYASYTVGTKFLSKQRSLTEEELVTAEEGMIELATLLPKNPGVEKVQAMLDADMNGGSYNESESAPAAKPAAKSSSKANGFDADEDDTPAAPAAKPAKAAAEEAQAPAGGSSDVDEMLAAIRARRKAAA